MSLNTSGLTMKVSTMKVSIVVDTKDPLIQLCNQINWESLYQICEFDLKNTKSGFHWLGRKIYVRTQLGVYVLQSMNKWTDRQTEDLIRSTPKFQVFCGFGVVSKWSTPDHTSIEKFRNRLSVATHKSLGDYILKHAANCGFADPSWMDIDSTVQEANMSYPADATLMKKLSLMTKKVLDYCKSKGFAGFENLDLNIKLICKKARDYFFLAKNTAREKKHEVFRDYFLTVKHELYPVIKAICAVQINLEHKAPWGIKRSIEIIQTKAKQYLLDVAHFSRNHTIRTGKILSLHLSAVACIAKGKVGKEREFGRQVQLGRIGGNFIVPLSNEVKMEDKKSAVPMVANHAQIFGHGCLQELGADKGFYTHENIALHGINTDGIQRPINAKGHPPEEVAQPLRDRRAGIEPLIGHLKHRGLQKSKMKSDATTHASVYTIAMGFNLQQTLRHMTGKFKKVS